MAIEIRSPHSGRLVKVREQDIGRSLRDEEGHVFYVLQRSDGKGYYGSPTRAGSEKDQQRYDELEARIAREGEPAPPETGVGEGPAQPAVHDATGPGRPMQPWRLVIFMLVLIVLIIAGLIAALQLTDTLEVVPLPGQPGQEQELEQQQQTQPGEADDAARREAGEVRGGGVDECHGCLRAYGDRQPLGRSIPF